MLYRQGEWLSVPITIGNQEAYQIFRQAEVASPLTDAQAYQMFRKGEATSPVVLTNAEAFHVYRLGEWTSVNNPAGATLDLTAYHLSERTLMSANTGRTIYLISERTLVDPQAGMETYLASERTSVPAPFSPYQRSEWFGQ